MASLEDIRAQIAAMGRTTAPQGPTLDNIRATIAGMKAETPSVQTTKPLPLKGLDPHDKIIGVASPQMDLAALQQAMPKKGEPRSKEYRAMLNATLAKYGGAQAFAEKIGVNYPVQADASPAPTQKSQYAPIPPVQGVPKRPELSTLGSLTRGRGRLSQAIGVFGAESGLMTPEQAAVGIGAGQLKIESAPPSKAVKKGLKEFSEAKGFGEALKAIVRNPAAVGAVFGESIPLFLPVIALGAAGSMAGPAGTGAAVGSGSAAIEYSSSLLESMRARGIDPANNDAVIAALQDPAFMKTARERAAKRGVAVGVFDALTGGLAGRFLAGATGVTSGALRGAGEVGLQVGGGMGGEATAQYATEGGVPDPASVLLEGILEIVPGAGEVALNLPGLRERKATPKVPPTAPRREPTGPQPGLGQQDTGEPTNLAPTIEVAQPTARQTARTSASAPSGPLQSRSQVVPSVPSQVVREDAGVKPDTQLTDPFQPKVLERDAAGRPLKRAPLPSTEKLESGLLDKLDQPPFYSPLARAVEGVKQSKAQPMQWMAMLRKQPGVKAEELEWTGLQEWMAEQNRVITKKEVQDYLEQNAVEVQEVVKGSDVHPDDPNGTKFAQWQLPGGQNYGELLLTLPQTEMTTAQRMAAGEQMAQDIFQQPFQALTPTERDYITGRIAKARPDTDFTGGHMDEPNVLAHVRFNERTDADGKRVLFIEEIQSDWHQKGRKEGYRGEGDSSTWSAKRHIYSDPARHEREPSRFDIFDARGGTIARQQIGTDEADAIRRASENLPTELGVPDAPFKKTWPQLAFRRMTRYAAENGFDRIAWTTGEQQADRYDLSKKIKDITLHGTGDNLRLSATDHADRTVIDMKHTTRDGLAGLIGKEPAEKLLAQPEPSQNNPYATRNLFGADLKVGGEGMVGFYDKMLPNYAKKFGKKFGAKVGMTEIGGKPPEAPGYRVFDDAGTLAAGLPTMEQAETVAASYRQTTGSPVRIDQEPAAAVKGEAVHSMDITPKMRESAIGGVPMFTAPGPIKGLKASWADAADTIIDNLAEGRYSPFARLLGGYPFKDPTYGGLSGITEYKDIRGLTKGKIDRVNRMAARLNEALRKLNADEQTAVLDYWTTKGANPAELPASARGAAVAAKSLIRKVGLGLVKRGLLSKEAYDKGADSYLHTVYLKHLLEQTDFGSGLKISGQGYLKKKLDLPQEYKDLFLVEVRDPGFLMTTSVTVPARDMAIQDFLRDLSRNPEWVLPESIVEWTAPGMTKPRRVTPFWLKNEANALRDRVRRMRYNDPDTQKRAMAVADDMENAAGDVPSIPEDYRQMPDSPRYGDLRGLVVRKEIFSDIVGAGGMWVGEKGFYDKGWDKLASFNAFWKMMKVPFNPPTQMRNFISNSVLLHVSGVPSHRLPGLYARAFHQIRNNGQHYRIALRHGIPASNFASEELYKMRPDILRVKGEKAGTMGRIYRMAEPVARLASKPGDLYQFFETWGKTVKIIDAMEREGMSENEAVAAAQEALFDYSLVPDFVKSLRSRAIGAPFITFYYKAFPAIVKGAIRHPGKIAAYYIIPYILGDMLLAALRDVNEDDVEKLRKAAPKWMADQGHVYIYPVQDESGRWSFVNYGYFLPWAMHEKTFRQVKNIVTGDPEGSLKDLTSELGILGGPVPQIGSAFLTGIDPFTGREIVKETDPPKVKFWKLMNYAWRMGGPSWLTDQGVLGHMMRSANETPNYYGDPPLSMPQAAARILGVNIYPVDPKASRQRNLSRMTWEIRKMQSARRQVGRNQRTTKEEKDKLRKQYAEEIDRLRKRRTEYRDESKLHPNLQ